MQLLCDQMRISNSVLNFDFRDKKKEEHGLQRLQTMFAENQASILELVRQRKPNIPRRQFKALIDAISTVTLGSFDDPEVRTIFPGACNRPNAIYMAKTNRVYVCPSLLNYPENTLKQILAHELGHVVQKMQQYIPCFKEYPKKHVEEIFADWVASKVLSEKIALVQDPQSASQQAVESQLLFLSLACGSQSKKPDWAQSHPDLQNRIEHIFLSQPAFQKALHCQSESVNSCG